MENNRGNYSLLLADNNIKTRTKVLDFLKQEYLVFESSNGRDALEKVARYHPDIIISDIDMPIMSGLEMAKVILKDNPKQVIILLCENKSFSCARAAMRLGVGYVFYKGDLVKEELMNVVYQSIKNLIKAQEEKKYLEYLESEVHAKTTSLLTQLSERRKVDKALQHSESRFRSVIENATEIICTLSVDGTILSVNRAFITLTNWHVSQWVGKSIYPLIHENDRVDITDVLESSIIGNLTPIQECRLLTNSEDSLICEFIASPLIENNEVVGVLVIIRDISYRKKVEQEKEKLQIELLQAQKLESIGRLAGGIAHDFNNALTAILGFSELALSELPTNHGIREYLDIIKDSGEKAAALTKQLLAFSRKQLLTVEYCCLNKIVLRMGKMLKRLIGDDVLLNVDAKAEKSLVLADVAQLEQVIMNLLINARDAMPKGGELSIATHNEILTEEDVQKQKVKMGCYVVLSVVDHGIGMTSESCSKIFEPFYTTKAPGEGTGLGLATVFGVLKQHHGFIECMSKVNKGSKFKAYLPITKSSNVNKEIVCSEKPTIKGHEHILVVDDEPSIRRLLVNVLRKSGYVLSQASSGEDALARYSDSIKDIDLLITDIVMPGINGKVLADRFKLMNRRLKTVYISGYAQQAIDQKFADDIVDYFLEKPLKTYEVSQKIRDLLDMH